MTAYSYTLLSLRNDIRALLNEPTPSFWSDTQLNAYINNAISDIAIRSGCMQSVESAYTSLLTRLVSFNGYKCEVAEYDNVALIPITPLQAGHYRLDGYTPQFWFEILSTIGIEPVPPEVYPLTLYTLAAPVSLVNNSDIPDIPYAFCHLIIPYALSLALREDSKDEMANAMMDIYTAELVFLSSSILANIPDGHENVRFQ